MHKLDDTASSLQNASGMHCRLLQCVTAASGNTTVAMLQTSAACCGLYAYRPTRGTISMERVALIAGDLDAVGWICRTPDLLPRLGDAFNLPGGEPQHCPHRNLALRMWFPTDIVPSLMFLGPPSCNACFPEASASAICCHSIANSQCIVDHTVTLCVPLVMLYCSRLVLLQLYSCCVHLCLLSC